MMISYLVIGFSCQAIVDYNTPNLLHLVRLALASKRLQIQNFRDSRSEENVVTAFYALLKSEELEKLEHSRERNVRVGIRPENSLK